MARLTCNLLCTHGSLEIFIISLSKLELYGFPTACSYTLFIQTEQLYLMTQMCNDLRKMRQKNKKTARVAKIVIIAKTFATIYVLIYGIIYFYPPFMAGLRSICINTAVSKFETCFIIFKF